VLNGPELTLPPECHFFDKEGHRRVQMRVRWFESRAGRERLTYRHLVLPPSDQAPDQEVDPELLAILPFYGDSEPPVVFGHYWMPPQQPACLAHNAACVDYSVASIHGGLLTAYRWEGERILSDAHLVFEPGPR
jgi:hypothetical protein